MDSTIAEGWQDVLALTFDQILQQLIIFAPKLIGVVVLLVVGWLTALILSKLARSGVSLLNKLFSRVFPSFILKSDTSINPSYINVFGKIVFWLVLLFFIAASANSLGLDIVSNWMGQLLLYLPRLVAGLLIMIGGYLASNLIKAMAISAAESAGFKQADLLGASVQFAVFFTAIVIGIQQLGINIQFFTQFFIVVSGVVLFGFSLAFGLGAKNLIASIIGSQQAQKFCQVGDELTIAGVEGLLIEITTTTIVLETAQGRTTIPAKFFLDSVGQIKSSRLSAKT